MLSQLSNRQFDTVRGPYPDNGMALGPQNVGNDHDLLRNLTRCTRSVFDGGGSRRSRSLRRTYAGGAAEHVGGELVIKIVRAHLVD